MTLPRVPAFPAHLQVELVESLGVFLVTPEDTVWLGGALHHALLSRVDGRRTAEELVDALEEQHPAAELYYALERLVSKGYLIEAEPEVPRARAAWWHGLGVSAARAEAVLASTPLRLVRVGDVPEDTALVEALGAAGLSRVEREGALTLVVVDDYLRPELGGLNREALASGRPWVLARLTGRTPWLGPLLEPGRTACWDCLAQRLRNNRLVLQFIEEQRAQGFLPHPQPGASDGSLRAAAHLLATSLARGVVTGEHPLASTLVTVDLAALGTEHHPVVRRPQCPACGAPGLMAERQSRPLVLEPRRKAFTQDGGHRQVTPEETLRRYQHHVSPLTGVVKHLKPVTASGGELTSIIDSGPNLARRSGDLEFLRNTLRTRSTGKGKTPTQARASALGEALERYSGVFQGDEARRRDTLRGLGDAAVAPSRLLNFSERQYRLRESWNAATPSRMQRVPHPFDEQWSVEWSPVWSLTRGVTRYVPTAYCYYNHSEPTPAFCWADSNGCAAGNSLEEACLQGFLELAERDAVSLWWYNRVRRPRLALESFDEPYVHQLLAHYRARGRELWVLDLTHDLGIPTFAALSRDVGRVPERISLGFGAHLEARLALLRALTEMNQFLPLLEAPSLAALPPSEAARWLGSATLAEHPYLAPSDEAGPARTAADFAPAWSEDLREDVALCVERARRLGLETLVLDQTRPDVGLSVVRVIVPGLRHMWPRFGPGRLHEVPVRLGWLPHPTAEEQLNPLGIFF